MAEMPWQRAEELLPVATLGPSAAVPLRIAPDAVRGYDQGEHYAVVADVTTAGEAEVAGVPEGVGLRTPPPPLPPPSARSIGRIAVLAPKGDAADTASLIQALLVAGGAGSTECLPGLVGPESDLTAARDLFNSTDQLVLCMTGSVDTVYAGILALDWVVQRGYRTLVDNAIVLIEQVDDARSVESFRRHFERRCRVVALVPSDPLLDSGVAGAFDELRPATQAAYSSVIDVIVDGLRTR